MPMQMAIPGFAVPDATHELLDIMELSGDWQTVGEVEWEGVLTTIATILAVMGGTIQLRAEELA